MARPKPDLPAAAAIRALADPAGRLAVRVTPGARDEGLTIGRGLVKIKVRARAHEGAANAAVLGLLAHALGCAPTHLALLRGASAREKLVQLPRG